MSNIHERRRFDLSPAEIVAEYCAERDDDFLDAIITAAALVSRADNWVQAVEQAQLLDFVDRHDFLSLLPREETLQVFESRVRELRRREGLAAAVIRLSRVAGRHSAPLVVELSEEIAAADCRLDPREQKMLALIRSVFGGAPLPFVRGDLQRAAS
ncbi:MAG TPA: tellurite resistance TerB family protein [Roseiarcus sp.]|nr:tellurite resistance TerB family protein [Roseiarcus sp.]